MRLFLSLCVYMCLTCTIAQPGEWDLIYHNGEDGSRRNGDLSQLINAVRAGEEIRVYWSHKNPQNKKRKVEHAAHLTFLTIQSDSIVRGQIAPIAGQIPNFENYSMTLKENLEWVALLGTDGNNDHLTRNVITGEIIAHETGKWETKWFVKRKGQEGKRPGRNNGS